MALPTPRRAIDWLPVALIVMIGVCYLVVSSSLSYLGDDLSFYKRTELYSGSHFYLFYKHIAGMWFGSNGRLQNIITPALFQYVPAAVLWIVNALAVVLLFLYTVKWCSLQSVTARVAVICVLAFGLPWWDMFLLFDVNIGYAGGMALALIALWIFFKKEPLSQPFWAKVGLLILGILAGGMHEALGLPLCVSLALYIYFTVNYKKIDGSRKWLLTGLILGTLYCSLAPGIWMRMGSEWVDDGPWWHLLLVSSYFVLLLIVAVAVVWIFRRDIVKRLAATPWSIFALMAVLSLPIVVVGGIVGRSGFFGQVPAIIALALLLKELAPGVKMPRTAAVVITVALTVGLVVHYVEFTRWQLQMSREVKTAISDYLNSPTGAVYLDFTNEPDTPWYLLRKTRGVPDEDDFYLSTSLTRWLGTPDRPFTVLPSALKGINPDTLSADLPLPSGYVTLRSLGTEMPDAAGRRLITSTQGCDSIAVPIPATRAYYVTAHDLDPSGSY